jgi:chemotaxis protein methyltransferase CheR
MTLQLSEREHRLFEEWLGEEFGLRFGPEKREILRSRLEPRRAELGLDSYEELYFHLKFHPARQEEWDRLIPHLTNNESYFFREVGQLDVLSSEILSTVRDRLEKSGRRELRILSAACAAGEEPYSLAMLAHDTGLFPAPWSVRVTGVDLDPQILDRARAAAYTPNAFRRTDESLKTRHFDRVDEERWVIKPAIREMVAFRRANLVDESWTREIPAQDVIFCRNVLIYFGEENTRKAVEGLYRALVPGGYLFLGHAESLSRVPTRLEAERRPGAIFYRRPDRNG